MTRVLSLRSAVPHAAALGRPSLAYRTLYAHPVSLGIVRLLIVLTALWLLAVALAPAAKAGQIFLPLVNQGEPGITGSERAVACDLSESEQALAAFLTTHPHQGRKVMVCDPILAQVARARAADMAQRGYFGHVNPDGFGPNYMVRLAGYDLPDLYGSDRRVNMVESIAAGFGMNSAQDAWAVWERSEVHRTHLLGSISFTAEQERYGVGHVYIPGSPYTNYWVFIAAHAPD